MAQDSCSQLGGNVGEVACIPRMKRPQYFLPTQAATFTAEELASSDAFKAALKAKMLLASGNPNKVYCFPILREVDRNTEEPEVGTLADGYEEVLSEKAPKYALRTTGNICQAQSMAAFNGWSDKGFVIDIDKNLFYVETDSEGGAGFSIGSLYTTPPDFAGGSAVAVTQTNISFGSIDEFKGNVGFLKVDFDPTKLANTNDVKLSEVDTATGYVFTIGGKVKCAKTNIYTSYKTLLAVVGAWKATRLDTNAEVTISSVTADDAHSGWDITLASSPTIATSTKIAITLRDPATLAALGTPVTGIESPIALVVTKPA